MRRVDRIRDELLTRYGGKPDGLAIAMNLATWTAVANEMAPGGVEPITPDIVPGLMLKKASLFGMLCLFVDEMPDEVWVIVRRG